MLNNQRKFNLFCSSVNADLQGRQMKSLVSCDNLSPSQENIYTLGLGMYQILKN